MFQTGGQRCAVHRSDEIKQEDRSRAREGMIAGMDPFTGGGDPGDGSRATRSVVVENLTRTFGPVMALSQLNVEMPLSLIHI